MPVAVDRLFEAACLPVAAAFSWALEWFWNSNQLAANSGFY